MTDCKILLLVVLLIAIHYHFDLGTAEVIKVLRSNQSLSNADNAIDGLKLVYNDNPRFEDFTLCMRFNFKSLYKDIVSIKKEVRIA